jgi:hypothetical protein
MPLPAPHQHRDSPGFPSRSVRAGLRGKQATRRRTTRGAAKRQEVRTVRLPVNGIRKYCVRENRTSARFFSLGVAEGEVADKARHTVMVPYRRDPLVTDRRLPSRRLSPPRHSVEEHRRYHRRLSLPSVAPRILPGRCNDHEPFVETIGPDG